MTNATALIDGLGGEKMRWTDQSKLFEQQINKYVVFIKCPLLLLKYFDNYNLLLDFYHCFNIVFILCHFCSFCFRDILACVIYRLVGDVLLATGFLSYSGPFNQEFRDLMLNNWKKEMRKTKIPFSEV